MANRSPEPYKPSTCDFATREDLIAGIRVDATVLVFDEDQRVYSRTDRSAPIYRHHFGLFTVVGETSRSWIVGTVWNQKKINKKTLEGFYSNECADRKTWVNSHGYEIGSAVRNATFERYDVLVEIAAKLGLDLPPIVGPDEA